MDLLPWLLALPFLPVGRGALILILGGVSTLSLSLILLLVRPRRIPDGAKQPSGGAGRMAGLVERTLRGPLKVKPGSWHHALQVRAAAGGIRNLNFQVAEGNHCLVLVEGCVSCRRGRNGCDRERRTIERAIRVLHRRARVVEVSCRLSNKPQCAFLIDLSL